MVGGTRASSGRQRWRCFQGRQARRGNYCYSTTNPTVGVRKQDGTTKVPRPKVFRHRISSRIVVVTSAQNATPKHEGFWKALEQYCNHRSADLVVIPTRYKNPTSVWTESQEDADYWDVPDSVLCNTRKRLNENLILLGDIKTQPTATSPLTGFEAITHGESGILGHTKLHLRTIATPQGRFPKILTTTGACTLPNYTDSRAGKLGEFHHTLGAVVVEIHGKIFHMRQLNAEGKSGAFWDRNKYYGAANVLSLKETALRNALVCGDTHVRQVDPVVDAVTYEEIVPELGVDTVVFNDLLDGITINPHGAHNPFVAVANYMAGNANVRSEVFEALEYVAQRAASLKQAVIVPSNHNDFLHRWLINTDWRGCDPQNRRFYLETALAMVEVAEKAGTDAERLNAFIYWARRVFDGNEKVKVLERDESHTINGIEVGMHGDLGPNGSRGSARNLRRIGVKSIIGHSHTPAIDEGCYQVGTSTRLKLGYNQGPSSWLNTHALIYPNGKRTLINIINGEWCL